MLLVRGPACALTSLASAADVYRATQSGRQGLDATFTRRRLYPMLTVSPRIRHPSLANAGDIRDLARAGLRPDKSFTAGTKRRCRLAERFRSSLPQPSGELRVVRFPRGRQLAKSPPVT